MKNIAIIAALALSACVAQPALAKGYGAMPTDASAMHVAQNKAVVTAAAAKVVCEKFMTEKQMDDFTRIMVDMGVGGALLMAEADMRRRIGHLDHKLEVCAKIMKDASDAFDEVANTK